jgi:hypothetical protein
VNYGDAYDDNVGKDVPEGWRRPADLAIRLLYFTMVAVVLVQVVILGRALLHV